MKIILKLLILVVAIVGFETHAKDLTVGSLAPAAITVDQEGQSVDLAQVYKENKFVLVYFYPKADTPGCTAQACSLRDSYEVLLKKGVKIFGVSTDTVKSQKAFHTKYKLPFALLADSDKKVIKAFGVSSLMGYAHREAFLIKDGVVVWLDQDASTKEQANDVLKYLESTNESGK